MSNSDMSDFESKVAQPATGLESFWPPQNPATDNAMQNETELRNAIEHCKELVLQSAEHSPERRKLVRQLVTMRKQLLDLKEGPDAPFRPDASVNGHNFVDVRHKPNDSTGMNRYCDQCDQLIWTVLQSSFQCTACEYLCHRACVNSVQRPCVALKVYENPVYILDICPEQGLAIQKYRCAECRTRLSIDPDDGFAIGRLCDYSGLYYCPKCHWNDTVVIPARVIRNWDFQPRPVSRVAFQYLKLMLRKPVLRLEAANAALFNYVQELREVKKFRTDIMIMKPFLMVCREAASRQRLFSLLKPYTHFIDGVDVYALQDLIDLQCGLLERHLRSTVEAFSKHIRDCQTCRGNGYICELCSDTTVLFSFDDFVSSCRKCAATFHRICFEQNNRACPRCVRRVRRQSESVDDDQILIQMEKKSAEV